MVIQHNNIALKSIGTNVKNNLSQKNNNTLEDRLEDKVISGSTTETEDFLKVSQGKLKNALQLDPATKQFAGAIGITAVAGSAGYYAAQIFGLGGAAVATGLMGVAGAIAGKEYLNSPGEGAELAIVGSALGAGIGTVGAYTMLVGGIAYLLYSTWFIDPPIYPDFRRDSPESS